MKGSRDAHGGSLRAAWAYAWRTHAFRLQVVTSIPILIAVLLLFKRFVDWVESRPGAVLADPVLAAIPPMDVTWLTFVAIYGAIVLALVRLVAAPRHLLIAVQSYGLMVMIRVLCMFVVPLEAPTGIIPLRDPFVELFGSGAVLTKDLFFSGHTATMVILFLTARGRAWRALFLLTSVVVGVCVLVQHVHYAADVLVAPFAAYWAFRIAKLVGRQIGPFLNELMPAASRTPS